MAHIMYVSWILVAVPLSGLRVPGACLQTIVRTAPLALAVAMEAASTLRSRWCFPNRAATTWAVAVLVLLVDCPACCPCRVLMTRCCGTSRDHLSDRTPSSSWRRKVKYTAVLPKVAGWLDARLVPCACAVTPYTRFHGPTRDVPNEGRLYSREFVADCCCCFWIRWAEPSDESKSTATMMVGPVAGWSDSAGGDASFLRRLAVEAGGRTFRWS